MPRTEECKQCGKAIAGEGYFVCDDCRYEHNKTPASDGARIPPRVWTDGVNIWKERPTAWIESHGKNDSITEYVSSQEVENLLHDARAKARAEAYEDIVKFCIGSGPEHDPHQEISLYAYTKAQAALMLVYIRASSVPSGSVNKEKE